MWILTPDAQTGSLGTWKPAADTTGKNEPKLDLKLLEARDGASLAAAADGLFLVGGRNASGPVNTVWKSTIDTKGVLHAWQPTTAGTMPGTRAGGRSHAFLIGGQSGNGLTGSTLRTNLAPKPPFFQLGLVGATVPGLKIEGDIGPQLGLLAAAGVGTGNFVILLLIAYLFAHKAQVRAWFYRMRERRRARET